MSYVSMAAVKRANKAAGWFWFSPNTVRAFKSRVESPLMNGRFWVESTRNYNDTAREFKIAEVDDDGDISYLYIDHRILCFGSYREAIAYLHEHVNES